MSSFLSDTQVLQDIHNPTYHTIGTQDMTGIIPAGSDSLSYTATSSTVDTYKYYNGGLSGTLLGTVTVTWTTSGHTVLVSVVRT